MHAEQNWKASATDVETPRCVVCHTGSVKQLIEVDERTYYRCKRCEATFLDPAQLPQSDEERAHYETHENDPNDLRYRAFLSRLATPLLQRLEASLSGLDYGCGPGPALAQMMREAGHAMAVFDPFFAPEPAPLTTNYDFITCTEVVEHFHNPYAEFRRLYDLLRPGGWLGVMTMFQTEDARFANWHYRKDPTHVVFYREKTLETLAHDLGCSCEIPAQNIALFRKPSIA